MASVLTIAVTLIAGAAVFGYVNGQAASSENNIGVANAVNVNFLNERYVVADMGFSGNTLVLSLYNNGNLTIHVERITLYNANKTSVYAVFNGTASSPSTTTCGTISNPSVGTASGFTFGATGTAIPTRASPVQVILTAPTKSGTNCLVPGTTYYVSVLGLYGNVVVSYACYSTTGCTQ